MCHASALCWYEKDPFSSAGVAAAAAMGDYDESTKGKGTEIARWAGNAVHGAKGQGETMSVPNDVSFGVLRSYDQVVRVLRRGAWPGRGVPESSKAGA